MDSMEPFGTSKENCLIDKSLRVRACKSNSVANFFYLFFVFIVRHCLDRWHTERINITGFGECCSVLFLL